MAIVKQEYIGNQRLILGDCLAVMPTLGRFDAVVTDPPYGIGEGAVTSFAGSKRGDRRKYAYDGWDDQRPEAALRIIAAMDAAKIIWGGNYFADLFPKGDKWLSWDKGQRLSQSDCELAYTSLTGALRVFTLNRGALLRDGAQHPTQKPVALMEWCLGFLSDAKTILDPFMGSGTTLVACQRMGRHGTGIELDPDYFQIACQRVDEAARQPDLLIPETRPQPTQEAMDL